MAPMSTSEPTSVAVLSDVHGVLPAVEAVLDEPDVRAAGRIVAESSYPNVEEFCEFFIRHAVSDTEAIGVMGPRDGRQPS